MGDSLGWKMHLKRVQVRFWAQIAGAAESAKMARGSALAPREEEEALWELQAAGHSPKQVACGALRW